MSDHYHQLLAALCGTPPNASPFVTGQWAHERLDPDEDDQDDGEYLGCTVPDADGEWYVRVDLPGAAEASWQRVGVDATTGAVRVFLAVWNGEYEAGPPFPDRTAAAVRVGCAHCGRVLWEADPP